ncbi:response regulator transcription factor [Paenibacillus donghaensis]|uniref:DNA-binding response regulator n=1 Tax=Paenibacillus donghaensis TaxID=414771 RepID=A0A2Z2KB11_9BACL|nr:response regulator transcription factor [Paenibacillus donghaensis]ASA20033.1 DNA-binding response regulator [Paenibacillus donghaensis]
MSRKNILIIEDERDLANMIKNYLIKEQYNAEICCNGSDALAVVERYQPHMVILDLMLPGKDGLEILRQVRLKSAIPVIIISAKETELDRILGLKIGADDYMTKPFSIKELVARVDALFRRISAYQFSTEANQRIQFNNMLIDLTSRMVTIEGEPVNLTAKEFDLLAFLLKHPKQVLSKEQMYDNVWGLNEYGDINTVAIHIQKIREKLGQAHGITTMRGIGYRFDGELK